MYYYEQMKVAKKAMLVGVFFAGGSLFFGPAAFCGVPVGIIMIIKGYNDYQYAKHMYENRSTYSSSFDGTMDGRF